MNRFTASFLRFTPSSFQNLVRPLSSSSVPSYRRHRVTASLVFGCALALGLAVSDDSRKRKAQVHAWGGSSAVPNVSRDEIIEILKKEGAMVDNKGQPVNVDNLKGKTFGLYFSALWCGPCMQFSPILRMFYKACNQKEPSLQILFVSCDVAEPQHAAYVSHAHDLWLHVPFDNQSVQKALKKACCCWAGPKDRDEIGLAGHKYGIPCLVLFHPDGTAVEFRGSEIVRNWYAEAVRAMQQEQK